MIGTSCPSHKWSAINTCSALTSRELHTVSSALTDWVASCGDRTRWWWWWCVRELMVIYGRFDASCAPLDSVGFDFVVPLHLVHFMDSCGSAAIEDAHSMWRFTWLMQREGEGGEHWTWPWLMVLMQDSNKSRCRSSFADPSAFHLRNLKLWPRFTASKDNAPSNMFLVFVCDSFHLVTASIVRKHVRTAFTFIKYFYYFCNSTLNCICGLV